MLALKITDIRDFTNKLFIGEVFDNNLKHIYDRRQTSKRLF